MTRVQHYLPYYVFFLVLTLGLILTRGGFERNLWSLRYLWHDPTAVAATLDTESLVEVNPRGHLWQAQDAFRAGDIAVAEEKITPLVATNQFNAPFLRRDTIRLYAAIQAEKGNLEQALALWQDIEDISSLQGFAKKSGSNGDLTTALQAYEIAYNLDQQGGAYQLANFLWRSLKEPDDAEGILRDTITAFPYSRDLQRWLHLLGQIYRGQERWEDAISIYSQLVQIEKSDATAALQLGYVMQNRGDGVAQVMTQFQQAVEIDPERGDGHFAIAQLLASNGEFQLADHSYQQAISRNTMSLSWYLAYANNARELNNPDEVLKRYKQIQLTFPDSHRALVDVAWAYYQVGQQRDAELAIDKALRLAGSDSPKWYLDRADKIYGE